MCLNNYDYMANYLKHMELASQAPLNFVSHEPINHTGWCFAKHAHFMIPN